MHRIHLLARLELRLAFVRLLHFISFILRPAFFGWTILGWITGTGVFLSSTLSWGFIHTTLGGVFNYNIPRPMSLNTGGLSTSGFGFLMEYMFSRNSGIESGVIYEPQLLNGDVSDNLVIPLMYRYWFTRHYTISVGGFLTNQMNVLPRFTEPMNYGARATLGVDLGVFRNLSLALEVGYQYGAANLSSVERASFSKDQIFAVIGFRFGGIQRKTGVAANGMKYFLDRPPEYDPPVEIPHELLP